MAHPVNFLIVGLAVAIVISLLLWKKKEEGQS
ncbi:LPXTG cell wall anchor domain-containing protein [Streptococcus sp. ZY1909104]